MTNEVLTANVEEMVLAQRRAHLLDLAREKGVKPFDPTYQAGDFWREGEATQENFDLWLRQLRHDAPARKPLE